MAGRMAFKSDGTELWIPNVGGKKVDVSTVATGALRSIQLNDEPNAVVLSPDDSIAYVTSAATGSVYVIDAASGAFSSFPMNYGTQASSFATFADLTISPDGQTLASWNDGSIEVIDVATTSTSFPVPHLPAVQHHEFLRHCHDAGEGKLHRSRSSKPGAW